MQLKRMLADLADQRLEVEMFPSRNYEDARRGVKIRAATGQNPDWYRRFCNAHLSSRVRRNALPDTAIRRQHVVRVLTRLAQGRTTTSPYAAEYRGIAERLLASVAERRRQALAEVPF